LSGAPTVQNDVDCARAALALVSDAAPGGLNASPLPADGWLEGTALEDV
jgi:hypothetical protein